MLFCSECLLVLMFFDSSSSSWLMSYWNRFVRKFVLRNDRKSLGCSGSGLGFLCLILVLFQKKLHWFVVMFSCLFCSVPRFFQLFSNLSDSMCFIASFFFLSKWCFHFLPFSLWVSARRSFLQHLGPVLTVFVKNCETDRKSTVGVKDPVVFVCFVDCWSMFRPRVHSQISRAICTKL